MTVDITATITTITIITNINPTAVKAITVTIDTTTMTAVGAETTGDTEPIQGAARRFQAGCTGEPRPSGATQDNGHYR